MMFALLLADWTDLWHINLWYALPAIIAVSLVYAGTRHERMRPLLAHAARFGLWIVSFMLVVFAVIAVLDWMTRT